MLTAPDSAPYDPSLKCNENFFPLIDSNELSRELKLMKTRWRCQRKARLQFKTPPKRKFVEIKTRVTLCFEITNASFSSSPISKNVKH